jgi:hypothetical protein
MAGCVNVMRDLQAVFAEGSSDDGAARFRAVQVAAEVDVLRSDAFLFQARTSTARGDRGAQKVGGLTNA